MRVCTWHVIRLLSDCFYHYVLFFLILGPSQCHIICPESIGSFVFAAVVFCDWVALQAKGETLAVFVGKDECALVTWFAASAMKNQIELICLKSSSMPANMVFYNRDLSPLAEAWMLIIFWCFVAYSKNSWVIHWIPVEWWVKDPYTWQIWF